MNILSIQSHVAYGHVGNSAAVFALQRLGIEVWPVHTVQFSNHPGYGGFRGHAFEGALIGDVVQGIEERGALKACHGVLSGYVGSAEIGPSIVDAVARVKRANPQALYCCDPVIGDVGRGVYVQPGVAEFIRARMVPLIGMAQAGLSGYFDDAGFPAGSGWEDIAFPEIADAHCYALEITGDSMLPVYRDGDRIMVSPSGQLRRGDRVVVKTHAGEVMAKQLSRMTAQRIELKSFNPEFEDRGFALSEVAFVHRIIWASQ